MATLSLPVSSLSRSFFSVAASSVCSLATLLCVRLSLAFLAIPPRGAALLAVALRLELLGCNAFPVLALVDRSKLMAAMAEPLLSCLA